MSHPIVKWSLRIVAGFVLVVVLAVSVLLGYLFYGDDTLLPPRLERLASVALNRPVHIEGPVALELGLEPRIAVSKFTIDNTHWGQAPYLAKLDRVDVEIRLLPAFAGVLEILSIELSDLDIHLERNQEGLANWDLGPQGPTPGPGPSLPLIHRLDVENVSVEYRSPGEPIRGIKLEQALLKGLDAPKFELAAYGDVMDHAFSLNAEGGKFATLLNESGDWPLAVKLTFPSTVGELQGTLRGPLMDDRPAMDLMLNIVGQEFEQVDEAFRLGTALEGPFRLVLNARGEGEHYRVSDLHASLGPNDLTGDLSWDGSGRTPKISVGLKSTTLDVTSFNALAGAGTVAASSMPSSDTQAAWHQPDLSILKKVDADVAVEVGNLKLATVSLSDLSLNAGLDEGRLDLRLSEGDAVELVAGLDAAAKAPSLDIDARLRKSDLTAKLKWLDGNKRSRIEGELKSKTIDTAEVQQLVARFTSSDEESSNGSAMVPPLPLPVDLDLNVSLGRLVDKQAPLEDLVVRVQLQGSVLKLPSLSFTADETKLQASATFDLSGTAPSLQFSAHAQNFAIGRTLPAIIPTGKVRVSLSDATMDLAATGKLSDLARNAKYTITSDHPGELNFHTSGGKVYRALLDNARMVGNGAKPIQVELTGTYVGLPGHEDAPVKAEGTLNDTQSLLFGGGPYRIEARGESRSTKAVIKVMFGTPDGADVDGDFDIQGDSFAELGPFVETELPDRGPLRLVFHLLEKGDVDVFDFSRWEMGKSKVSGRLHVDWSGERPRVDANVDAEVLNLNDLVTPELAVKVERADTPSSEAQQPKSNTSTSKNVFPTDAESSWSSADPNSKDTKQSASAEGTGSDQTGEARRVIPNFEFDREVLNALNGKEVIRVHRLISRTGEDLGSLDVRMELENGRLQLGPITGSIAGSDFTFNQVVDTSASPASSEVRIDVKGFDLGTFLKAEDVSSEVEGTLDLTADLKGRGNNFRESIGNSTGKLTLVGGKGKVPKQLMRLWGGDLTRAVLGLLPLSDDPYSTLNCVVLPFSVTDGQASMPAFLVDTTEVTVVGQAEINLKTEAIHALLKPGPKDPSLFSLALPLEIKGTLGDPDVAVTDSAKVWAAGKAVISFINPLAIPLLFGDLGDTDKNPCETALEQLRKGEPLRPEAGRASNLQDAVEGAVKKGVDKEK